MTRARFPLGRALIQMADMRVTGREATDPKVRHACQRAAFAASRIAEMEMRKVRSTQRNNVFPLALRGTEGE